MGMDDFLDGLGTGIKKIGEWTSFPGIKQKPILEISGGGIKATGLGEVQIPQAGQAPAASTRMTEATLSGLRWLYSNGISEPISTAALVGKMNRGKDDFFGGDYFSTEAWSKAYKASQHISPGQALAMDPEQAQKAIESGLIYYKPPEAYLPPGFSDLPQEDQQKLLKEAGMPAVGNAYVEKMRGNSAWFKYGSGAIDFATMLFADPTVLAARTGMGLVRINAVRKMPKRGWSEQSISQIMTTSNMRKLQDGIWANRQNPQLLMNTEFARHSGMGPSRFAAIASRLKDPDELDLFIRTGMGDLSAMSELRLKNVEIDYRMMQADARLSSLGLMRDRFSTNPGMQALVDAEIARTERALNADSSLFNRYEELISSQGQLNKLYMPYAQPAWLGRLGFQETTGFERAAERTTAQNIYVAGPARGGLVRGQARGVTVTPGKGIVSSARYTPTPVRTGIVHTRLWGAGDYFAKPLNLVQFLKNAHPRGYVNLQEIDEASTGELRAYLARMPGIGEDVRSRIMNEYLQTTTEAQRLDLLEDVGRLGFKKVAEKRGVPIDVAEELYKTRRSKVVGVVEDIKRYTAAVDPERTNVAGQPLRLDELRTQGDGVTLSPFTATRLANTHVLQDLDMLDTALARHGGSLNRLRVATGNARDAVEGWAEHGDYLWKFATLFRFGYIARVLGDDIASQWAAAGSAAMFMRASRGVKNMAVNMGRFAHRPAIQGRIASAEAGVAYADEEIGLLASEIKGLERQRVIGEAANEADLRMAFRRHQAAQAKLASTTTTDAKKLQALKTFARQREQQLRQAELRAGVGLSPGKERHLANITDRRSNLQKYRDLQARNVTDLQEQLTKVRQGNQAFTIDGVTVPAAYGGREGEYFLSISSADETLGNLLNTNKQMLQQSVERSFDHGAQPITATQAPGDHLKAWAHAVNNQIMQDPLSRMAVEGSTIKEMTQWLTRNPRGMAYRARMPKMVLTEEFARSAKYEVDQYLPTAELRMKALEGPVPEQWLAKAFPDVEMRPEVHLGRIGTVQLAHAKALDRVIQKWYHAAVTIPADTMSRHPLFNQLYEGEVRRLIGSYRRQGQRTFSVDMIEGVAHSARNTALRDMRTLVFDIAHRSDAAAAMRFISPFFSATSESFQRWGRVFANRPQTVGYVAQWYNAPIGAGVTQDSQGNHVDQHGYAYIPVYPLKADGTPDFTKKPTVQRTMVPKGDRYIVTRLPKWLAESSAGKLLNVSSADGKLMLSQNSINMITQGDPWFNPGFGPIVSIPVNEWVKDKPRTAEIAREIGVLPFGPQGGGLFGENPLGRAFNQATPAHIRNFLTTFDTSDERFQRIKMQILQREIYEFSQRHDGRQPSEAEIGAMQQRVTDKTRQYWMFTAVSSFIQPMATQRRDEYQFFRDQYNALRRQNPLTADDEYLNRYGESHFIFAQEASRSYGIPPTNKAVALTQKYRKEIAQNPELAALIVGPEGNGPFSREAYAYQLNTPLVPGGVEMMRTKLSADEMLKENQRRLGWAKYTSRMNDLNARLRTAGFESFSDEGAEDFAAEKEAWTSLYAEPLMPDGSVNKYYNAEWSKDFFTQDRRKYERLIPGLTALSRSPLAALPERSDLRVLQQYLGGRQALVQQLNELAKAGEPHTLKAEANSDLRRQWIVFVDQLIESDTRFGDLYHRYLSRDLGTNAEEEAE